MDIIEAIYTRQSVSKVRPDPVPRELIERLLAAAVQAPNHHKVRPWRFIVLTGEALCRLGDVMAASLQRRQPGVDPAALEVEKNRPLRAPVIIAVGVDKPSGPKVVEIENVCAAAAASQNILLAAHGLGLGGMWRTGPAAIDPDVKKFLGLESDQYLIGFLYIGYPEFERTPVLRPSYEDRTTWMS
ncbi:MAG: nitroreductase [Chloroflexi bacterium]|nr:MAG: nitroreductase [Chloroflexota bacterium]